MLWAGGKEMAPSSLHLTDGVPSIAAVQPVHVSTWIEASTRELDAPSVKPRHAREPLLRCTKEIARTLAGPPRTRFALKRPALAGV